MDDLANELEATSFTQHAIQPVVNTYIGEEEDHEESRTGGDNCGYNEGTVTLLQSITALKLKVPTTPKVPRVLKDNVGRTPDGVIGRPKLVSWASEMSMYDGCSPISPGLPKNLPTPKSNPNLKMMFKDVFYASPGSEHPAFLPATTEADETSDNDLEQSQDDPSEEEPEDTGVKGRPVMCTLEVIENGFVTLETPSSPSSHGFKNEFQTIASVPSSCEPKVITGVISNSTTSTDRSSSSQNSAQNEPRTSPKLKPNTGILSDAKCCLFETPKNETSHNANLSWIGNTTNYLRFDKRNTQSNSESPRKKQSSSKRHSSTKGQNGSSRSKGRSKKPSGTKTNREKRISAPVFDFQNLIINYLPPKLGTANLRQLFERFGSITNCKVVVDHETGLSKGYGFVKFQTRAQAEKAIEELNHYQIGSKTLKVSYARRTLKQKEKDGVGGKVQHTNLYIANLDKNIDSSDLQKHFSSCGYIVQCRVLKDEQGATRRIGFVRYDTHESALKAIKRYDGKKMYGTKSVIQVRFANSPRAPPNQTQSQLSLLPDEGSSTMSPPGLHAVPTPNSLNGVQGAMSLNGMLPNVPGQGLIEVGGHYVPLSPANMQSTHGFQYSTGSVLSPHGHLQQGFQQGLQAMTTYGQGYVASQATYAPLHQQGSFVPGVIDKQQPATSNNSGTPSITNKKSNAACYVAGIDIHTEESMLKSTFGGNKVKSVRIIRRKTGPYAFVNYFNFEDAAYAAETFNNTKMGSQTITVRLKTQQ